MIIVVSSLGIPSTSNVGRLSPAHAHTLSETPLRHAVSGSLWETEAEVVPASKGEEEKLGEGCEGEVDEKGG